MTLRLEKINRKFRNVGEKILDYRWLSLAVLTVLLAISVVGIQKVKLNSSWDTWFFEDDPIMIAKKRFENIFGNSDGGAILVQSEDVFSYETLSMIQELSKELEQKVPLVDKIVSLTDFEFSRATNSEIQVGNLVPDVIPKDKKSLNRIRRLAFSKKNLVNKLFSDDSKETWIQIRLRDIPDQFKNRPENKGVEPLYVIGKKIQEIVKQDKYKSFDLKDAGMTAVAYDKTVFFKKESGRILMLALLASIVFLIIFLRSLRGVVVPLVTVTSAIFISYGFMGHFGIEIDAFMLTMPIYLALAVSIGYSIHILNFFKRRFIETGIRRESVLYAIEHTGWPLFFTALTTIGCMLAFNLTEITTVRWVGNASASMVVVVYIFAMVLNPIFLSFGKDQVVDSEKKSIRGDIFFEKMGRVVMRWPRIIVGLFVLMVIILGYNLKNLRADFEPFKGLGLKIPYVKKLYDVSNSKTGTMYNYEIIIDFPENGMAKEPENLKKLAELEAKIYNYPLTKNSMSILDVIKDMNRTFHNDDESYYRIPNDRKLVSQLLLLYENSGGKDAEYWMDYDYKILRLQIGIKEFSSAEVEEELYLIEKQAKEIFPSAKFGMVGTSVEGAVVNNYIARGQVKTFLIALLVIGILMIIVFRSFKAGLIGLVPNLIPVIFIGGTMALLGFTLDMMSMTIIPMIMGIAVDDSIHFITHIKLEIERGANYKEAIYNSYKTVGKALFMTSMILIITFGMYMTSIVRMYQVLGALVGLGLFAALMADYFLAAILIYWTKPFKRVEEK